MFEYQISVSRDGKFVFRTDWESDRARASKAYSALVGAFRSEAGYKLAVHRRSPVMDDGAADLL